MKKLDLNNLDNVSGGFAGSANFNFGEQETKQEIADFMEVTNYNKQQTQEYFKEMANHFADACQYNYTKENEEKAQYYTHLYNTMAREN